MSKLNLSLIVESENETKDILMDMLMNYDNLHIYKVKKQENIINTETKEIKKGSYKIDFILLLQFGFNESTCFSTRFNRFLVEKGPVPRREKQRFSMRKI